MFKKTPLLMMTLMAAAICGNQAEAKVVGHYTATLESRNEGGRWNDLGLALMGWDCYGSQSVRFFEPLLDHKGRVKEVEQNSSSRFNYSVFMMNGPVVSNFSRDMNIADPRLSFEVKENCSKTEYYTDRERYTETDSNGRERTRYRDVRRSRTLNAWMSWSCDMTRLPEYQGGRIRTRCIPNTTQFVDYDLESLLVSMFRQKTFDLTLELTRVDEKFVRSINCGGRDDNRVVISLQQGVGGHVGENDFVFHVNVDGHKFDIKTGHGLLNDEIEYCGAGTNIDVKITATEEDLFFDDEYKPASTAQFTRNGRGVQTQAIEFKRKTYFGEAFTDKVSTVSVTMREASRRDVEMRY